MSYLYLALAILFEVVGTTALKASEEFTKLYPSLVVTMGYGLSFYFMALTLRTIPLGVTYAIWSGVGIVLVALAGLFIYGNKLDWAAILGMALIVAGVVVIQLFSKSISH